MEPVSLVAFGAAIGGAAGKFVEKAWDSGEKWLASHLQNHRPQAIERAQTNMGSFLRQLACAVETLEQSGRVSKLVIETAQDHPDFSILLQRAMLAAAQTEDTDKQAVLARLVSERLAVEPESLLSLTSKMACDAIPLMNIRQLKILGLKATARFITPNPCPPPGVTAENFANWANEWFARMWAPYQDLEFGYLDLEHLDSISCLRFHQDVRTNLGWEINRALNSPPHSYLFGLAETSIGRHIAELWDPGNLSIVSLTTTGQLVGIYVSDLLTNQQTALGDWD